MKPIDLNIWAPVDDKPGYVQIVDQPTAQDVYTELKQRLESIGYLPDEYFLLDAHWENGVKIPAEADIFCTADYGSSEGIYLNVYLKWRDRDKSHTASFITGKTLDDTPAALDKMHLISSAIINTFHGDGNVQARYIRLDENDSPEQMYPTLTEHERGLIDSVLNYLGEMYDSSELYKILNVAIGLSHEDIETLGFDISDCYVERENMVENSTAGQSEQSANDPEMAM